jgi:light-regulated signal transduction histidine kinase (bacteriophytochrome)
MSTHTGKLLKFSQVSREPMKRKRVSMHHVVRECIAELDDERQGRDIRFNVETLDPARGNRAMLKQLILNLLENALKFTSECEHAEIQVGCTRSANGPVYFVRDNGIGFEASDAESMFLVFRRFHRSHKIEGSGVGLAIAKRIIERHEGRIWAEGEPGRGCTIYFTLGELSAALSEPEGGAQPI